jgi:tetratricopeptide (TPR) repeat protein
MAYASQLDSYHKDEVYEALVQALADGGDFDQALLVAKAAGDQGNGLYYAVAWSASKQGKLDDVLLQSLRKVEGEYALVRAADLLSEAGNFAGAVRLLDQVKPTSSLYKIDLANAWLNADQIERAAAVFEGKDGKDSGLGVSSFYLVIAVHLIKERRLSEAAAWLHRGLDAARLRSGSASGEILSPLKQVIEAYYDVGERLEARKIIWQAYDLGPDPSVFAPEYTIFEETLDLQAKLGLYEPGTDRERLVRFAKAVPEVDWSGNHGLGVLAKEFADMGDLEGALGIFPDVHGTQAVFLASEGIAKALVKSDRIDEALRMMSRIPPNPVWIDAYISPILESVMAHLIERNMLQRAGAIIDGVANPSIRSVAQSLLVQALVKSGRISDAVTLAGSIGASSSPLGVSRALGVLLKSTANQSQGSVDVNALAKMENGADFYRKGEALKSIVENFVDRKMWKEAKTTAIGIEERLSQRKALEYIGVARSRDGALSDASEMAELLRGQPSVCDCRIGVVRAMVQNLIANGKATEAVKMVESADDAKEKAWILVEVVKGVQQPGPSGTHP